MKNKTLFEKFFYLMAIGFSMFLLFFFITSVWIGYEVKLRCQDARREYDQTNCVSALIMQLEDEHRGFRARNDAIWALGQLGDSRALPVLEKYYTGVIPDREPLDKVISQYELKKAVNLTSGGVNATAWTWRWGIE